MSTPAAAKTFTVASVMSGPMPSPGIRVTTLLMISSPVASSGGAKGSGNALRGRSDHRLSAGAAGVAGEDPEPEDIAKVGVDKGERDLEANLAGGVLAILGRYGKEGDAGIEDSGEPAEVTEQGVSDPSDFGAPERRDVQCARFDVDTRRACEGSVDGWRQDPLH